jgi:ferredoxin
METSNASNRTEDLKHLLLSNGAALVGVANLWAIFPEAASRGIAAVVIGLRYPDPEIDLLPNDEGLQIAMQGLAEQARRLYAAITACIGAAAPLARCCRIDGVEQTFGKMSSRLVTDAPLVADAPCETTDCGTCRICQQACPAKAVLGEEVSFGSLLGYRIDRAACEAYLCRDLDRTNRREFCGLCLKECPLGKPHVPAGEYTLNRQPCSGSC